MGHFEAWNGIFETVVNRPVYREYAPPQGIDRHVECFWSVRSDEPLDTPVLNRVLPDGCMDIVFNLGDAPLPDGVPHHGLRAYVVGAMTQALPVRLAGGVDFVGARFRPGAAVAVIGVPAADLTDRAVALDQIGGRIAAGAARVLESGAAAMPALASMLRAQVPASGPDPLVTTAWTHLRVTAGGVPIRDLAASLGVTERRLQRIFREVVGLSPKEAARVARLQAALGIMRRQPDFLLCRVAHDAGYYDQAHFNREFGRLTGTTPQQWRAERVASVHAPAPSRV